MTDLSPWHARRRKRITGSSAADLIQQGYGSPLSVYLDKMGQLPEVEENESMYWGNRLEIVVVEEFLKRTGYKHAGNSFLGFPKTCKWEALKDDSKKNRLFATHIKVPYAGCTPDALYLDKDGHHCVLECKTTGFRSGEAWGDEPPLPAQIQLQWNLYVTGLQRGALACLVGGQRFVYYEQDVNPRFQKYIAEEARKFYYDHLKAKKEPDPGPGDMEVVRTSLPHQRAHTIVLPGEAAHIDAHIETLGYQIKLMTEDRDGCRARIMRWMGAASYATVPGTDNTYSLLTQDRGAGSTRVLRRKAPKG